MTASPPPGATSFAALTERARGLLRPDRRALLGITGSPGAGKTTLARALVAALAPEPPAGSPAGTWVTHLPMDGYHLADVELDRLGRRHRKGAPDTFDPAGYRALLARVRAPDFPDETVYAPMFERDIEQPVANAIPVHPECRLVVSEGNYLLVDDGPWRRVRDCFDEVWFCDLADDVRLARLVARHEEFGKPSDAARAWVRDTDEPNARLIQATRARADLVVTAAAIPPSLP
jgi:pantothenate kinase